MFQKLQEYERNDKQREQKRENEMYVCVFPEQTLLQTTTVHEKLFPIAANDEWKKRKLWQFVAICRNTHELGTSLHIFIMLFSGAAF